MTRLITLLSLAAGTLLITSPASAAMAPGAASWSTLASVRGTVLVESGWSAFFGQDTFTAGPLGRSDRPGSAARPELLSFADGATGIALGALPAVDKRARTAGDKALGANADSHCAAQGHGRCDAPQPATYALVSLAVVASLLPGALRRRRDDDER
ncbi:hypothetical protein [Ideonella sp. A 288]|uniref:hypothetical protein n=1 Tax=Ideonella sp. A 288 TaxID=1962181 RepID=UPI000B4ABA4F|nr:hypothetical protein [Ideonella sp. A 288]